MSKLAITLLCIGCYYLGALTVSIFASRRIKRLERTVLWMAKKLDQGSVVLNWDENERMDQ